MQVRKFSKGKWVGIVGFLVWTILFFIGPALSVAADYPSRPITINVGFPPGSGAGNGAQIFAEHAKKYLPKPQPILVNFKPGAASAVSADYVLKQPADGYNLLWILPDLMGKLVKDGHQLSFTKDDFYFIGAIGMSPCLLTVNKEKSPYKKLEELIADAKKNPGKVSYATSGVGSGNHLSAEIFQMQSGIKLNQVPFAGGAKCIAAVLGGHVDCFIGGSVAAHGAHIKPGGGVRVLTVFAPDRWPEFPNVPTAREVGYDIDRSVWFSFAAPKGTPQPVLDVLLKTFKQTMGDPDVKAALKKMGYMPMDLGPKETRKKADEEYAVAKEVFTKLGLVK